MKIAPSILSADFATLGEAIARVEAAGADLLHVDVMDGHFVPNLTIGPAVIKALRGRTRLPFDCHLMISEPQKYIDAFLGAGANLISIHVEAEPHLQRALQLIRDGGAKAGIAINPATSAESLTSAIEFCDYVLVMTVNPGFGGQAFLPEMLPKIRRLRAICAERGLHPVIEVDGGENVTTAGEAAAAGATAIVAGSAIFDARDYAAAIAAIRASATAGATRS